jgi:hypothetical protein
MRLSVLIGSALLAAGTLAHAQVDDKAARRQQLKDAHAKALKACEGKPAAEHRACVRSEICAQSKDAKACQERFVKADAVKSARAKAAKACEGKQGTERGDCMRRETCAQAKDPAQCEARIKEAAAKREKIREACKDRKGEDYRACVREQRGEQRGKT